MCHNDMNATWHNLVSTVPSMNSLRNIRFGNVPGYVLHVVFSNLTSLEHLTAELITDYTGEQMWYVHIVYIYISLKVSS